MNNFDLEFKKLVKEDSLPISAVEDLMLDSIEEYKQELIKHTEELLKKEIDEGNLIVKKNKNGKIVDIISVTKGKKS